MSKLWADSGEASQGKIVTALLRDDEAEAARLLRMWSTPDLLSLLMVARRLDYLIGRERIGRVG